jgi:hypothetical protein
MQLKNRTAAADRFRQVGGSLAAATAALLGTGVATDVAAQELTPWEIDTAMLYYGESDGRVRDFSMNALARKETNEDTFINLSLALDTLTGASPSGAVPTPAVQTFTRPSGNAQYLIGANQIPLDDSFQDTRVALSGSWDKPISRLTLLSVGASYSDEYDYTHTGINAKIARDFNNRNTTFSAGFAVANDTIDPVGGAPAGLTPMLGIGDLSNRIEDDQNKDVTDFLLGVTQVINRQTVVQFNFSLSQSDGYQSDPYKILTVVDGLSGMPVAGPAGTGLNLHLFEQRPDQRDKQSLFGLVKRDFGGNVLDMSLRFMTDDWGIDSQTVDFRFRWNMNGGRFLEPHLRFYSQNAADFYRTVLIDGQPLPAYASADYRLADFSAFTVGIKYGKETRKGEYSTRLEFYQHSGNPDPAAQFGALAGVDLYPDLSAVIAQFSYSFGGR